MMTLQAEHKEWLADMYPQQPVYIPAAGCVEEAGELMHALIKCEQAALWGREPRYADCKWPDMIADAIGDCAIYACSLCTANEFDFNSLLTMAKARRANYSGVAPLTATAYLVSAAVNIVLQPTHSYEIMFYLAALLDVARVCNIDFDAAVQKTWEKVKVRKRSA